MIADPNTQQKVWHSTAETVFVILSIILALAMFTMVFFSWERLPDLVPTHFGYRGKADDWGSKEFLWLLPILYVFVIGIGFVARKFPQFINLPFRISNTALPGVRTKVLEMLALLTLQVGLTFCYITVRLITAGSNLEVGLGVWFAPLVFVVMVATIAMYLLKIKKLNQS